jgi:hypothetical protein
LGLRLQRPSKPGATATPACRRRPIPTERKRPRRTRAPSIKAHPSRGGAAKPGVSRRQPSSRKEFIRAPTHCRDRPLLRPHIRVRRPGSLGVDNARPRRAGCPALAPAPPSPPSPEPSTPCPCGAAAPAPPALLGARRGAALGAVRRHCTQTGVPIGTSFFRRRMSLLRRRMHPCDGSPGISWGSLVPCSPTTPPPGHSLSVE